MRIWTSVAALSPFLAAGVAAASRSAHVFIIDANSPRPTTADTAIDPHTAQLIFARRLGLSSLYEFPSGNADALAKINAFGGGGRQLLKGSKQNEEPARVLVVVDNVEKPQDLVPSSSYLSSFDLSPAPHPSHTEELLATFEGQARELSSITADRPQPSQYAVSGPLLRKAVDLEAGDIVTELGNQFVVHIRSLRKYGSASSEYKETIAKINNALSEVAALIGNGGHSEPVTLVLMPSEQHCAKRSVKTYAIKLPKNARQVTEAPLSSLREDITASPEESTVYSSYQSAAAPTLMLKGPIPSCFSSKDQCEHTTGNCTSRGECMSSKTSGEKDCWSCTCNKPDVRKNKDGTTKTTRYGGAACQKKDVVMPFWLLAGTSVFIVFLISSGIGLLYSIGEEDLPSVIGAGVTGPRANK